MQTHLNTQPSGAAGMPRSFGVGLSSAPSATPAWNRWAVVPRARGWHVSRETTDGARIEFLLNEVHRVRIFRSPASAAQACAQANFDADAKRLAGEPLLQGAAS